ncbi:MAG: hypothetical protein ACLT98_03370 [Eggerthellaceae bacterium]
MGLIAQRKSRAEIEQELFLSQNTVKTRAAPVRKLARIRKPTSSRCSRSEGAVSRHLPENTPQRLIRVFRRRCPGEVAVASRAHAMMLRMAHRET